MATTAAADPQKKGIPAWQWGLLGGLGPAVLKMIFGDKFDDFVMGSEANMKPFDLYESDQTGFQKDILGQAAQPFQGAFSYLNKLFGDDEESLKQFAAPYMRQFETQIAPMITERFGGGDSGASSGLQNALSEAGSTLQSNIYSDRQRQQLAGMGQLGSFAELGMKPRKGFQNIPGQEGALHGLIKALPYLAMM